MPTVEPGDWVRFYQNGTLAVGVVQYVCADSMFPWNRIIQTDIGQVSERSVLETRKAVRDAE